MSNVNGYQLFGGIRETDTTCCHLDPEDSGERSRYNLGSLYQPKKHGPFGSAQGPDLRLRSGSTAQSPDIGLHVS
jgi:hypothetical protein